MTSTSSTPPATPHATPPAMAVPGPDASSRDELGRLVAARWHGATPDRTDASGRWLVAVDGSEGGLRAAAMAAQLAAAEPRGAVDLVHVTGWLTKEAAEAELPRRGWHASAAARALVKGAGIAWRLHVRMGEPAQQIVALSQALGSRGIAIGSHGLNAAEALLLGSVAYKVVHLGTVPVLVVR